MIAPPTPWAPRAIVRKLAPVASAHANEPPVKVTIPLANRSRRP